MKRYLTGFLAALLCLALAACAADGPDGAGLCLAETDPDPADGTVPSAVEELSSDTEASQLPQPNASWDVTEDITLSLLQAAYPVGTQSLTMVLENRGTDAMLYGQGWTYEKFQDGQWLPIETIENYGFTMEGYILQPGQLATFPIGAWFLAQPLEAGYYRVTGCALRVAEDEGELSYGGTYAEYPAYQLEFLVTEEASSEPDYAVFVSSQPVSPEAEALPVYLLNMTGEDASVLFIPTLERKSGDGAWSEVPFAQQVGFCGTYDPLPAGGRSWSEPTEMLWGTLEEGRYRLSYAVTDSAGNEHTASGEFTAGWELCGYPTAEAGE